MIPDERIKGGRGKEIGFDLHQMPDLKDRCRNMWLSWLREKLMTVLVQRSSTWGSLLCFRRSSLLT